jgi:glycerol-3-phosphate cytidylyltransferase-like family protein
MIKREKIVVVCGEFDPISYNDLKFLRKARHLGHWLIVGVHSDLWMKWCRDGSNQDYEERRTIIESMNFVDEVFRFNDSDGTVCNLLKLVKYCYPLSDITYVTQDDMHDGPELKIRGIKFETIK